MIPQLSVAGQPRELTEPMIQFHQAVHAEGAQDVIYRSGFMNVDAKKLEFQIKLFVAVEKMASRRLDLLAQFLHQRSTSAAVSPADFIIYAAVFAGIPDNSDFIVQDRNPHQRLSIRMLPSF